MYSAPSEPRKISVRGLRFAAVAAAGRVLALSACHRTVLVFTSIKRADPTRGSNFIRQIQTTSAASGATTLLDLGKQFPSGLAIDQDKRKIFWTELAGDELAQRSIKVAPLNGPATQVEYVVSKNTKLGYLTQLELDPDGKQLFWETQNVGEGQSATILWSRRSMSRQWPTLFLPRATPRLGAIALSASPSSGRTTHCTIWFQAPRTATIPGGNLRVSDLDKPTSPPTEARFNAVVEEFHSLVYLPELNELVSPHHGKAELCRLKVCGPEIGRVGKIALSGKESYPVALAVDSRHRRLFVGFQPSGPPPQPQPIQ